MAPPPSSNGAVEQQQQQHRDEATETSPLLGDSNGNASKNQHNGHTSVNGNGSVPSPHETDDNEPVPEFLINSSPTRFWLVFWTLLINVFIASFDGTIMASSHPVITSYFHAANSASWLSTVYLLSSTAFQPILGRLSDATGRKPLFVTCSIIFFLATVWCALAGSIESFIAARTLCGLGAGGAMSLGGIITSDIVPIQRRGAYQAIINIVVGVGAALGAALGGAMAENLGWRWEFGVQLPFLAFCTLVSILSIPADLGRQDDYKGSMWASLQDFDATGSVLLTILITFLILGLNLGGNVLPWSHPLVIVSLVIFAVLSPILIRVEYRAKKPVMPLNILTTAPRANLVFSNFIAAVVTNALLFNIPLYYQAVLLSTPTDSGLRLVVPSIVASAFGALTGMAITWTGRLKWPVVTGTVAYAIGCLALSLLRRDLPEIVYLLALVPMAAGQGFQFPGTFMAILGVSKQSEQAVITSTLILWRSLGLVLGVAVSSLLIQNGLIYYLDQYVDVPNKVEVITLVRKSVAAIAELEGPVREQVIHGYEATMRLNFIACTAIAVVSFFLVVPIKLPRLPRK